MLVVVCLESSTSEGTNKPVHQCEGLMQIFLMASDGSLSLGPLTSPSSHCPVVSVSVLGEKQELSFRGCSWLMEPTQAGTAGSESPEL